MDNSDLKKTFFSLYIIFMLIVSGFISILTFEGIIDIGCVSGSSIIVAKTSNGDYTSIQEAIDNANPGDTIYVWAGTYIENVIVNIKVNLIGNSSTNTTIDGGGIGDVLKIIINNVLVSGFSIVNSGNIRPPNWDGGIALRNVQNVTVINNNCSNNQYGIFLSQSEFNQILNNTCNLNNWQGIYLWSSHFNNIINNTSNYTNVKDGIRLENSNNNNIVNNTCNNNNKSGIAILISNSNKVNKNICESNTNFFGIALQSSSSNKVENNVLMSNYLGGIQCRFADWNIIKNNICDRKNAPGAGGIILYDSSSNIIINNTLFSRSCIEIYGKKLENWNTHSIDTTNTINGKAICYWKNTTGGSIPSDAPQVILANCTQVSINNVGLNSSIPIQLGFSSNNSITNNSVKKGAFGIYLKASNNNYIFNNDCDDNGQNGIYLIDSDWNTISNNNCSYIDFEIVTGIGINLTSSNNNIISNNTCNNNTPYGIKLDKSKNNIISFNNASKNDYGIILKYSSDSNIIKNNNIFSNDFEGISIFNSNNSNIYFNNFINNSAQAKVTGDSNNNQWDNGKFEGNYWSDYKGLDNGADGRIAGDGIGDTELPHLGLDSYPFINRSGCQYPGIPHLFDPIEFDPRGEYSISWLPNRGTKRSVLEEDENSNFNSPIIVYNGSDLDHQITSQKNGTYYYRLKALSENYSSPWSNIVNITVDWPPNIPQNLTISVHSEGNTLNISWSPNLVDTTEYHFYYKNDTMENWIRRSIIQHPKHSFNDTNLIDGQNYSYKLQAIDARGQFSNFTDIISAVPLDTMAPGPPTGLSVVETSVNSIKLEWESNSEDDLEGYFIYRSKVSNPATWGKPIGSSPKGTEEYLDLELDEQTIYYYVISAFDEVPNNSSFSNIVNGTTKLGQYAPEINNSLTDFEILEDTVDTTINLYNWFKDINNDILTFRCSGDLNIAVTLDQMSGSVTLIPTHNWNGFETLTFYAEDGEFEISANVTITVIPLNDPPERPEIISPTDGLNITEGKKLDFEAHCFDPDLPYGDELIFTWSSDTYGELGTGNKLDGIKLPAGKHEITLTVTDTSGNFSVATINITVLKEEAPVGFNYNLLLFPLIIIIIIIVLFLVIRKRRTDELSREEYEEMRTTRPASLLNKWSLRKSAGKSNHRGGFSGEAFALKLDPKVQSMQQEPIHPVAPSPPKYPMVEPQIKLIGRNNELKVLLDYLTNAISGKGSTIFISGEAGIGKTRLLNELIQFASARGVHTLTSNCAYESLTPFLPIKEALKGGELDHLFAEEAPRVEAVYLVSGKGLLIKDVIRKETKLNPDLFASMLITVGNFVRQSLSILSGEDKKGFLNTLGFENYRILIENGEDFNLVVIITGHETEFLINDMRDIFSEVGKNYKELIKTWDGDEDKVIGIGAIIQTLISSGKYDGVYYGESDPKVKRNRLFENVSMGLVREAQKKPILLCIEDLQWSDPSSLALIHNISKNSSTYGLVIIGTFRAEEITSKGDARHPMIEIMQLLDREEFFFRMELPRLPKECISEIITSMFGGAQIDDEVRDLIYRETEGNPLFIIELVKYLVEESMIMNAEGTWKLAMKVEELNIPPKIYQVILRRMSRLDKKFRDLLDYASVIGETFSSSVLVEALKAQRFELLNLLRDLEQKFKLIISVNGNYRFAHAKIKEVIYSEIPPELRMSYHSIIANSIETLNRGNLDKVLENLAFHYYQCKNKAKALFYLLLAAKKARNNYSNKESIRFYQEALDLEEMPLKRIELLTSLGEIYDSIGEYDKSLGVFNSALGLTNDPKMLADIRAKIGIIYLKKGDYDNSIKQSTLTLELVKDSNSKEEASGLETLGLIAHRKGQYDNALKYHRKSLDIREKLNDLSGKATSLKNIGLVLLDQRDYDNALKNYTESLTIFEGFNDIQGMQTCLNDIAALNFQKGEYEHAFEFYNKSYNIIGATGDQSSIAILLLNIGQSLMLIDEGEKALDNLNKSLKISKDNDLHIVTACNYWVMAEIYIKKRELRSALEYCNLAFKIATELGNKEIIAALRRVFGIIYKEQRRWESAIDNFEVSIKIYKEIDNEKELGDTYFEYGLMWKAKGEVHRAKDTLKEAINIFKKLKLGKHSDKVKSALRDL